MSLGTVSYAAPIASTPSTLGVTSQPRVSGAATGSTSNAAVATGFSSTPATTPVRSQTTVPQALNSVAASTGNTVATAQNAHSAVSTQFGSGVANDLATASAGGAITSALNNGVSKIAAFAQNGIKNIELAMQGDMNANNGQIDPAKMQQYTMQMSTFEMIMQMAAKIQEKQERAAQIWLQ